MKLIDSFLHRRSVRCLVPRGRFPWRLSSSRQPGRYLSFHPPTRNPAGMAAWQLKRGPSRSSQVWIPTPLHYVLFFTENKYVPSFLLNNIEKDIARCRFADAMWHNTGVVKIKGKSKSGIVSIPNPPDPDRNYLASNQPKGELDSLFLEDVININDVGRKSPR